MLLTSSSPPIIVTSRLVIVKPNPVPPAFFFASSSLLKGSKIFFRSLSFIPIPLSLMINSATSFLYLTVKLTPPTEVYLTALDSIFIKICLNLFSSV